jgi:hypothetical protein
MCIKDYETKLRNQGPVKAIELLGGEKIYCDADKENNFILGEKHYF